MTSLCPYCQARPIKAGPRAVHCGHVLCRLARRRETTRIKEAAGTDRRMDAYYYWFDRTGVDLIDAVLSAVAIAGKAYHHTESWSDEDDGEPSYVQRIQDAANEAATTLLALIAAVEAVMGEREWRPIETAPKDRLVLVFGAIDPHPERAYLYSSERKPKMFTAYWDEIDHAWCPNGATWEGPWVKPTHWMPLPAPPAPGGTR